MAVVVSVVAPGLTADAYDAVTAKVMDGDQLPEGCQLHIGGPVEEGWRVITVWDTPEAFHKFRDGTVDSGNPRDPRCRRRRSTPGPRCAPGAQANHRLRPIDSLVRVPAGPPVPRIY